MKKLVVLGLLTLITACSSQVQKGSISLAYSNYEDRDYEDTLTYITQAETSHSTTPELKAELTYLKAQTYEKMGRYDEAKALYQYLAEQHSKSQYGYQAKMRLKEGI